MKRQTKIRMFLSLMLVLLMIAAPAAPMAQALSDEPAQSASLDQAVDEEPTYVDPEDGGEPLPEPGAPAAEPAPEEEPAGDEPPEDPQTPEDGEEDGEARGEEESQPQVYSAAVGSLKTGGHDSYMTGYSGGYFYPNRAMSRAEVCKMFYNLLKQKPGNAQCNFTDVKDSDWFAPAVAAMSTLGAVNGYTNRTFNPNGLITRAEFIAILCRFFEIEKVEEDFSDVPKNHWAYEAIAYGKHKGWINGYSDGTFVPNGNISRCEAVKVMNLALGRRDDAGFAADRDTQEFVDVSKTHWAFMDIAEAADPADEPAPTPIPTTTPNTLPDGTKVGSTVRVNAETGLNIRRAPVDGAVITAVPNGTLLTVTDISKYPWLGVRTSGGITGYSSSDYLVLVPGTATNTPAPPSQNGTLSAGSITLHQYQSYRLDASASTSISSMVWSSTNPNVAKVGYTIDYGSKTQSAIVYAGSPGTATLRFADGTGSVKDTCTVTVTAPEPVRFAYADGNTVAVGTDFDLVAVTDTSRDKVRFEITSGPASGAYETTSYREESRESSYGLPTNRVRVFRRTVRFGAAGLYTVRVHAGQGGSYASETYSFTVLVTQATSATLATSDTRRTSGKMIDMIKVFEGDVWEIEDDQNAPGNPTVGHGFVVQKTSPVFYNTLTTTEAYAMLVNTVNTGSFAQAVENFRRQNNIKMSQAQFDALVSFVYNCGANALNVNSYDTPNIILNMVAPPSDVSTSRPYTGTLNVVKTNMYYQASSSSSVVMEVPKGAAVSITGVNVNRSSTNQEIWYRATYAGKTGWIPSGYVKLNGNFTRDLNYADSTSLANEFIQWHKGGGRHLAGLLYRRLAECKIFFFGNYSDAVNGTPNYRKNTYGFLYPPCCSYLDQR